MVTRAMMTRGDIPVLVLDLCLLSPDWMVGTMVKRTSER